MKASEIGMPPTGSPQQTPKRPDWMRPAFTPPDEFIRKGMLPMRRIKDWPREVKTVPEELVIDVKATSLELRVGNVLPSGFASLFFICTLPLMFSLGWLGIRMLVDLVQTEPLWLSAMMAVALAVFLPFFALFGWVVYLYDFKGGLGDILTVFDRKNRKVYQRVSKKLAKGEWDWDKLVPYVEERNSLSAVVYALTFVEFNEATGQPVSYVSATVVGKLDETYAFLREFMENGVSKLPPITLSAVPLPGWYIYTPPWFFELPVEWAKTVWATIFALFGWPAYVWSWCIRRFQPYNHWPAERVAQWQADAADATPQEKQWIADNVEPPPKVPLAARIGFALAVIVSSPVWWSILTGYVAGLAKFAK